jgi:hypothetical protein
VLRLVVLPDGSAGVVVGGAGCGGGARGSRGGEVSVLLLLCGGLCGVAGGGHVEQEILPGLPFGLYFDYDRSGDIFHSGRICHGVRAYRFRSVYHCTPWHIDGSYDTLVEITSSDWIEELWAALPVDLRTDQSEAKHFMIFLDSTGCYEVAGRSWEALREREGLWSTAPEAEPPNGHPAP